MLLNPSPLPCINPSQILTLPSPSSDASTSYILSIHKLSSSQLLLSHGTSTLTVVDSSTFKVVDTWVAPEGQGHIVDIAVDNENENEGGGGGQVWTAGKEGAVRGWDSRVKGGKASGSGGGGNKGMRVQGSKITPLLSLASAPKHHLLAAGTELTNHEATIVYWDHRSPSTALHLHPSLHSDDITSLSFLPSPLHHLSFPVPPSSPGGGTSSSDAGGGPPAPTHSSAILLSGSTDGLMAITNALEPDEDEAALSVGNGGVSVAKAGWVGGGGWDVWGRDDMDGAGRWEGGDFTQKSHVDSLRLSTSESITGPPAWSTDYLIDLLPSLSLSDSAGGSSSSNSNSNGLPTSLVGDNSGNLAIFSSNASSSDEMNIAKLLRSGFKGHRDVVRSSFYDPSTSTLYTGSEDSVLCAWSLASQPTPAPPPLDVEMGSNERDSYATATATAMDEDEEIGGGKRRRAGERERELERGDAGFIGGDGGWAKRGKSRR